MCEKLFGVSIDSLTLVHLKDDGYVAHNVPYMKDLVMEMMKDRL